MDEPVFYNVAQDVPCITPENQAYLEQLHNAMAIPLSVDGMKFGFLLLANGTTDFSETHFRIAIRLGQLFSLAFQRSRYLLRLEEQANHDPLTGCFNRRAGMAQLDKVYRDAKLSGQAFSLVFFDVNDLKKVNDNLGHEHGDDLIQSFASIVKSVTRGNDIFSRYGGDEFILVLPKCREDIAHRLIDRTQSAIDTFNQTHNKPFNVSISWGCIEFNKDSTLSMLDLVKTADERMYAYKTLHKMGRDAQG